LLLSPADQLGLVRYELLSGHCRTLRSDMQNTPAYH
jgi:hypothetical protein